MLRLPPFRFERARTVDEALSAWQRADGEAHYLAGGTDLVPNMKRRQFEPSVVIGIRGIAELGRIERVGEELQIGAGVTLRRLAHHEADLPAALREAAGQVATPQIQRMATLGGNLCVDTRCNYYNQTWEWRCAVGFCMKKDGDVCLVAPGSTKCWAISSSDTAPALIALGAEVELQGPSGSRRLPLAQLYRDDGIEYLTRRPGELLVRVRVPHSPGLRSTYVKVRRRGGFDFPLLGVGAAGRIEEGVVRDARLVLGAVHTHPVVVAEAGEILDGEVPDAERIEAVAEAAFRRATPLDNADLFYYWRKRMVRVTVRRALAGLFGVS